MKHPTEAWQGQTRREENVVKLLMAYADLVEVTYDGMGDEPGVPGMPMTYTRSVRFLEESLVQLRDLQRSNWWHTNERFINCTKVRKELTRVSRRWEGLEPHESIAHLPGGWTIELADERNSKRAHPGESISVTVYRWNSAVRAIKVRRGVEWIANRYYEHGLEPELPQAAYAEAA